MNLCSAPIAVQGQKETTIIKAVIRTCIVGAWDAKAKSFYSRCSGINLSTFLLDLGVPID